MQCKLFKGLPLGLQANRCAEEMKAVLEELSRAHAGGMSVGREGYLPAVWIETIARKTCQCARPQLHLMG